MKKLIQLIIPSVVIIALLTGCFSKPKDINTIVIDARRPIDYKEHEPMKALEILEKSNLDWVNITDAPKDWIKKKHISALINKLDSTQPCAGVHSSRDSKAPGIGNYAPRKKGKSTIGHEAAHMIESYRSGLYPKSYAFSIDWPIDKESLRKWWKEQSTGN